MRALVIAALAASACGSSDAGVAPVVDPAGGFFDAPFPISYRERADRSIDVGDFPNDRGSVLAGEYLAAIDARSTGFGRNTGVWFRFDGSLDPVSIPAAVDPVDGLAAPVYLVDVDPDSPARGTTVALEVAYKVIPETYSPADLLVMVPSQGHVLAPDTWYAAVVTTELHAADGDPIARAPLIAELAGGGAASGERASVFASDLERLWSVLDDAGIDRATVAGATVYRTGDFTDVMFALAAAVRSRSTPAASNLRVIQDEVDFVVLEGDVEVPLYQVGTKPYDDDGYIVVDGGAPVEQARETVRFSLSLPKATMPAGGFPVLLYSAGQGGSYLQVVDRGRHDVDDDGDGPALYLARRGIASFGVEANLTGPRHPSGSTSGIDFFNVQNPIALLDNHRQAAAEFGVFTALLSSLAIDTALVPAVDAGGAGAITFDTDHLYQWGHSTGSLVTAMSIAVHPELAGGILSGAGGSWLYNLTLKQSPPIPSVVSGILGLAVDDAPDIFDPILNLVAMLWEPIEPMNYAADWTAAERSQPASVLLVAGITDTYYLPRMQAALAVAADMDVVAPVVDDQVVDLLGRAAVDAPVASNHGDASLFMVQYPAYTDSDGHYVPFEVEEARYQYACFLASAIGGEATVQPAQPSGLAACP